MQSTAIDYRRKPYAAYVFGLQSHSARLSHVSVWDLSSAIWLTNYQIKELNELVQALNELTDDISE
jgi:hypothetical protein